MTERSQNELHLLSILNNIPSEYIVKCGKNIYLTYHHKTDLLLYTVYEVLKCGKYDEHRFHIHLCPEEETYSLGGFFKCSSTIDTVQYNFFFQNCHISLIEFSYLMETGDVLQKSDLKKFSFEQWLPDVYILKKKTLYVRVKHSLKKIRYHQTILDEFDIENKGVCYAIAKFERYIHILHRKPTYENIEYLAILLNMSSRKCYASVRMRRFFGIAQNTQYNVNILKNIQDDHLEEIFGIGATVDSLLYELTKQKEKYSRCENTGTRQLMVKVLKKFNVHNYGYLFWSRNNEYFIHPKDIFK